MKLLGLIGGTTWVSTVDYYRAINRIINERLGGNNSAKLLLYSINFDELRKLVVAENYPQIERDFISIAKKLEKAGADYIVICANTPHMFFEAIQKEIGIPILHIAEAASKEIMNKNIRTVGLLGTKATMEMDFYKNILLKHGIKTLIPGEENRNFINESIYKELSKEIFTRETKDRYLEIIAGLQKEGAEGIILGCTEIPLIISQADCSCKVFDTTLIHATYAVDFALNN